MSLHKNLTGTELHSIQAFEYASETERLAATGFISTDIGKVALQSNTNSFWILTTTTPTWLEITGTTPQTIANSITVGTSGAVDFTSIADAVNFATAQFPSLMNTWVITVYPGVYTENNPMTLPVGVTVGTPSGQRHTSAIIRPTNPLEDLFIVNGGVLSGFNLEGVSDPTKSLVRINETGAISIIHSISVTNCARGITIENGAIGLVSFLIGQVTLPDHAIDNVVYVDGYGSKLFMTDAVFTVPVSILPSYIGNPINTCVHCVNNSISDIIGSTFQVTANNSNQISVLVDDDSTLVRILSCNFDGGNIAAKISSTGSNAIVDIQASTVFNYTTNFVVDSSTGSIFKVVATDDIKDSIVSGGTITGIISRFVDKSTDLKGLVQYVYPSNRQASFSDFIFDRSSTGLRTGGGAVTIFTGLTVDVADGYGWVRRTTEEDVTPVSWDATSLALTPNATNYIFYNGQTLLIDSNTSGTNSNNIQLATVFTNGSNIRFIHNTSNLVVNTDQLFHDYLLSTRKFRLNSGLAASQGSSPTKITIDGGSYYITTTLINFAGSMNTAFSYFYNNATVEVPSTDINTTQYDNGGILTIMTDGYFRVDTIYLTSDGRISVIYGTDQFATGSAADGAPKAVAPSFIEPSGFAIANVIVQKIIGINTFIDLRQTDAAGSGGVSSGVTDHGLLSGLLDDDHPQYLLDNGSRAMSGDLNMGANSVTNINLVDGIKASAHGLRHNPGQSDAIATAAPVAVLVGASIAAGSAASVARSDHQHGIAAGTPVAIGQSNNAGTASTVARADHLHDHGAQPGGDDHALVISDPAGTAGFMSPSDKQKLDGVASSATNTPLSNTNPFNVTKSAAAPGISTEAARQDHKHDISTAIVQTIAAANAEGTATTLARSDHIHAHGLLGGGSTHALVVSDPGGTAGFMSPSDKQKLDTVTSGAAVASVGGTAPIVSSGGTTPAISITAATTLAAGSMSALDKSKLDGVASGATNTPLTATAPVNVTKATAAVGVSTEAARQDHKHDITTAAPGTINVGDTALEGSATSIARSDHTHALTAPAAPVNVTKATAAAGSATTVARSDHKHDVTTAAPGTISVGDAAAEGGATSLARSDHTHALTAPTAPANVDATTAAAGSATTVARSDHKHNVNTGTPVAIGTANAAGSATTLTLSDHVHRGTTLQTVFAEISSDTTTVSTTFVDLISQAITTTGGNLIIHMTASASNSNNNSFINFRITVDGTAKRGAGTVAASGTSNVGSVAIVIKVTGLSAAAHTIKVQWLVSGNTGRIRPVTVPDEEHASLMITEVTL